MMQNKSAVIDGIIFKELVTYTDERGFFRELIRATDSFFDNSFGQWSQSMMFDDVIKAWHMHNLQTDWWYVCSGVLRVGLCDMREESPTYKLTMDFLMGDYQQQAIVKIPPGIAHGCKVVQGPVNLMYVTSDIYNPADEIRIPYDSKEIAFDWLASHPIK